ncbi:DUF4190 domain-containing protein [Streptomyces sp. ST2-7A]|uniref:DUF4190 domain-containing protein n=1 Tax=Streptomyces sp. ST2-7A TaxID=2907214 RepID=UPI001F463098|nr:DUF4190 domain-containing protein [Streptomyces sp. ST2-7A]MCE7083154.1 septum formation family protein [Streptomyces sp. ST2-7A]
MSIAALVLAFPMAPIGLILGIVALVRLRRHRPPVRGRGFAIAAIVVGCYSVVMITAVVVPVLIDPDSERWGNSGTAMTDLAVGTCFLSPSAEDLSADGEVTDVETVPCAEPHDAEVVALLDVGRELEEYPGEEWWDTTAYERCAEEARRYAIDPWAGSAILEYYHPSRPGWAAGDHIVTCVIATPGGGTTDSMRGFRVDHTPEQLAYLDAVGPYDDLWWGVPTTAEEEADVSALIDWAGRMADGSRRAAEDLRAAEWGTGAGVAEAAEALAERYATESGAWESAAGAEDPDLFWEHYEEATLLVGAEEVELREALGLGTGTPSVLG